ncbi:MAG: Ig-like domain-containing protein, partial [Bacteroides sp.]|nr:Ig-like domain-containing protein [Bacteroides sp.]
RLTWQSSDEEVATVSSQGLVTAIKPGSAIITAVSEEGGETSTCSVTVSLNDPVSVSGEVSGTWEKYTVVHVTGHLYIPAGKSLTIEEGVEVIISTAGQDANDTKIEIIVRGNLYAQGTEEAPILISVPAGERTAANAFARLWGGIIGSETCEEILLDHVIVEYTGAVTTLSSPSVTGGLFKPAGGEGMVAFNTNNPSGKYVIRNSVFRNCGEDAIYVQGGSCIFAYNTFYAVGEAGGEAINVKAGCKVDAAFNLVYSANTNALKLSNAGADGGERFQAQIHGYNNTVVNTGWRRDPSKPKGGCIWGEAGCLIHIYNNLMVNCMFGAKAPGFGVDATEGPDLNSKIDYNFYASGTQESTVPQHIANGTVTAYDGFKPNVQDVVYGAYDKAGTAAGDNDPLFANFPFNSNPLLSYAYDASWDFHLEAGSPALNGANTDFNPYFASTGITVNGKTYTSPKPASYFGAFGQK